MLSPISKTVPVYKSKQDTAILATVIAKEGSLLSDFVAVSNRALMYLDTGKQQIIPIIIRNRFEVSSPVDTKSENPPFPKPKSTMINFPSFVKSLK